LLTMSAATGIDQLHRDFPTDLRESRKIRMTNRKASVIGNVLADLEQHGASGWRDKNVEWFLIYLITEIGVAPQNSVGGRSAMSLLSTLQSTLVDLKRERYGRWERQKTIRLVQDHLICLDDLKLLQVSYVRKLELFQRLETDIGTLVEADYISANAHDNNQSANERVKWAIKVVSEDKRYVDHMLEDLTASLNALFHLRSIEQNELAMVTDDQNRALYLFTGITIVFLPLSFFTSYFGMNIADIRETDMEQGGFWKFCGAITAALILLVWSAIRIRRTLQQRTKLFREMAKPRIT